MFGNKMCKSTARLDGKTVVITGANTGIGRETVRDLYRRGARVIIACRNEDKAKSAIEDVIEKPPSDPFRDQFEGPLGELDFCKLNLTSLKSVRECAKNLKANEAKIDILINNAGVMVCPFEKTEDGFETQFQTNHLGHFLLTLLLLPTLKKSESSGCRIVNVSSLAHERGDINFDDLNYEKKFNTMYAYAQSKLANILFTKELAKRLKAANLSEIHVYSLHPGVISSDLGRHLDSTMFSGATFVWNVLAKPFIKSVEQGAQTTIYCAVDEKAGEETGLYYRECGRTEPSSKAKDAKLAERFWEESIKLIGWSPSLTIEQIIDKVTKGELE